MHVALSFFVLDLVREGSVYQRLRGKGRMKRTVLLHASISQILNIIHSGLSGIRTHGLCLVTGAPSLPKSDFFKT